MIEYPYPQTKGRQRNIALFRRDQNTGKIARPTRFEAQSLTNQKPSYINNFLGKIIAAKQVKAGQSMQKAQLVTGFKIKGSTNGKRFRPV